MKLFISNLKGGHGLPKDSLRLQTMSAFIQKLLREDWSSGSVGQWVSSMIGKRSYEFLVMMPRLHAETNEKQHKRFAQHIGSPRRGVPGRRWNDAPQNIEPDTVSNKFLTVMTDQSGAAACCPPEAK